MVIVKLLDMYHYWTKHVARIGLYNIAVHLIQMCAFAFFVMHGMENVALNGYFLRLTICTLLQRLHNELKLE
jgi:hypothetical protein